MREFDKKDKNIEFYKKLEKMTNIIEIDKCLDKVRIESMLCE